MALARENNDSDLLLWGAAAIVSQDDENKKRGADYAAQLSYEHVAADLSQRDALAVSLYRVEDEITLLCRRAQALGWTRRLRNQVGNLGNFGARLRKRIRELGIHIAAEDHAPRPSWHPDIEVEGDF